MTELTPQSVQWDPLVGGGLGRWAVEGRACTRGAGGCGAAGCREAGLGALRAADDGGVWGEGSRWLKGTSGDVAAGCSQDNPALAWLPAHGGLTPQLGPSPGLWLAGLCWISVHRDTWRPIRVRAHPEASVGTSSERRCSHDTSPQLRARCPESRLSLCLKKKPQTYTVPLRPGRCPGFVPSACGRVCLWPHPRRVPWLCQDIRRGCVGFCRETTPLLEQNPSCVSETAARPGAWRTSVGGHRPQTRERWCPGQVAGGWRVWTPPQLLGESDALTSNDVFALWEELVIQWGSSADGTCFQNKND